MLKLINNIISGDDEIEKFILGYFIRRKGIREHKPHVVSIQITAFCNLSCVHCVWQGYDKTSKKELDYNQICRLLDELADMGVWRLYLTGGEPLIRKNFTKIAKYIRKKQFVMELITTNATLVTDEIAEAIVSMYTHKVSVTFLGVGKTHDKLTRVNGSYENKLKGIKLMIKHGLRENISIKFQILKQNVREIKEVKKIANDLGVYFSKAKPDLFPCLTGDYPSDEYLLTAAQSEEYYRKIFKETPPEIPKKHRSMINGLVCTAGTYYIAVSPYGEIMPCHSISSGETFLEKPIKEIWRENKNIQTIRNLRFDAMKICKACDAVKVCGICPGSLQLTTGSLTTPSGKSCTLARAKMKVLKELKLI